MKVISFLLLAVSIFAYSTTTAHALPSTPTNLSPGSTSSPGPRLDPDPSRSGGTACPAAQLCTISVYAI